MTCRNSFHKENIPSFDFYIVSFQSNKVIVFIDNAIYCFYHHEKVRFYFFAHRAILKVIENKVDKVDFGFIVKTLLTYKKINENKLFIYEKIIVNS